MINSRFVLGNNVVGVKQPVVPKLFYWYIFLMISWRTQSMEFIRSYWMPVSAFFGIPFVALANKYRRAEIDFSFLHAFDVASLSFSLWGSFAVLYFAIYCAEYVWLRIVPFIIGLRIDKRAIKFLERGVLKDPLNVTRYIDFTDRLKLEYSEAYQRLKIDYFRTSAWALLIMWTGVWGLPFYNLIWVVMICYGLFKFDDATIRLRNQMAWKPYEYRYAADVRGTREERVERFKAAIDQRAKRPKLPWPKAFFLMLKDLPKDLSFKIEWNTNHAKITAAVSILVLALNFGNAMATAAKDGPNRLFGLQIKSFAENFSHVVSMGLT